MIERVIDMEEKILRLLQKNARMSKEEIAVMLGISEEEVEAQIAAFEARGVIKGYTAVIDWEKVGGNHVSALIELKVAPKKDCGFDETAKQVMELKEVESVYLMSGGYDLLVEVKGTSFQEIAMFVAKRLSPMDSVLSTTTHFLLTKYKEDGIRINGGREEERRSMVL